MFLLTEMTLMRGRKNFRCVPWRPLCGRPGKGITEKAARLSWPTVFITWRNRCSCVRFIPVYGEEMLEEIKAVKTACGGKLLKVIIETCLLTEEEKIELCRVVSQSGAEYIKTSTGFGGGGATREDVALFKAHVAPHVKIKAAGGIADLNDAKDFVALGADRLGTSRIVKAVKAMEK